MPAGVETSDAVTDSRQVCDVAGNCATAGPVAGNKVDKKAPEVVITTPAHGARFLLNQQVATNYECDDGSGVGACAGSVPVGTSADTSFVGTKTFTVQATDAVGNLTVRTAAYAVSYDVCALYDQTKARRSGSTIPIKLRLCDAGGANFSSASIVVSALGTVRLSDYAEGEVEDAGQANPDDNFRFTMLDDAGGYVFNLKTTGLGTGTYALVFSASGDPVTRMVRFQIK